MALVGRAAQLKRRAVLVKRHGHIADDGFVDELSTAVGKPGQIYMVGAQGTSSMCEELPPEMEVSVSEGESHAQAMLLDYHTQACSHAPGTKEGRDAALMRGWAGPQQALALQGRNTGSLCMCNAVVCMRQAGELVGLLAMHVGSGVRKCVVQAIHVAPKVRGPWKVPNHLWEHARSYVAGLAGGLAHAKGLKLVRFSLELPCCMSQKGAHFWIYRMGWDGDEMSRKAAAEWGKGTKWEPGSYGLWYHLHL